MDIPNTRPGALSGTMRPLDGDNSEPHIETVETPTQDNAGAGGADAAWADGETYAPDLTGSVELADGEQLAPIEDDGDGELIPPADLDEAIEWIKAAQPDEGETRRRADAVWKAFSDPENSGALSARITDAVYIGPPAQTVGVEGIASTSQLGDVGAPNPDADGSGDPAVTGEPSASSEAESSDGSVQSDADPASDTGQNSTSSSDDTGGN